MKIKIALLPGDGIGPEVVAQAVKCLQAVEETFHHQFYLFYWTYRSCFYIQNWGGFKSRNHSFMHQIGRGIVWYHRSARVRLITLMPKVRPENGLFELRKN